MIPVYVISLTRSTDRRAAIAARLSALRLRYTFFDAIDGMTLPADEVEAARRLGWPMRYGKPLLATEIGCAESHRQVCARIADGSDPFGCVLEDDVSLHSDALALLDEAVLRGLPRFDVLRLHQTTSAPLLRVGRHGQFQLHAPYCMDWGMYAQIYTRAGAAKATAGLADRRMPGDHVLFHDGIIRDLRVLEVKPPVAFHPPLDHDCTTIDPHRIRGPADIPIPWSWVLRRWAYEIALRRRRLGNFVDLWGHRSLWRLRW